MCIRDSYYIDFKSTPSSGDVDVVLINNNVGGNGNDLAIDDISFSPCGPATSVTGTIGNVFTSGAGSYTHLDVYKRQP